VSYVTDNQVGDYERNPRKIAVVLKRWFLSESEELKEMSNRAKSLCRPDVLSVLWMGLPNLAVGPDVHRAGSGGVVRSVDIQSELRKTVSAGFGLITLCLAKNVN